MPVPLEACVSSVEQLSDALTPEIPLSVGPILHLSPHKMLGMWHTSLTVLAKSGVQLNAASGMPSSVFTVLHSDDDLPYAH